MSKFGGPYTRFHSVTSAYTYDPTAGDARVDVILVDASAGAVTITLPDPTTIPPVPFNFLSATGNDSTGRVRVVKIDATSNPVTIAAAVGSVLGTSVLWDSYTAVDCFAVNNAWYGNLGAQQRLFQAKIALSSAEILALNATPKTLIPAPGTGKVIVVRGITLKMVTTATQYANGGALEFRYTNASGAKVTADIAAAVVTAAAGTSYTSVAGVTTSLTNVVNSLISLNNATAAFITGTGTGVIGISFEILEL